MGRFVAFSLGTPRWWGWGARLFAAAPIVADFLEEIGDMADLVVGTARVRVVVCVGAAVVCGGWGCPMMVVGVGFRRGLGRRCRGVHGANGLKAMGGCGRWKCALQRRAGSGQGGDIGEHFR